MNEFKQAQAEKTQKKQDAGGKCKFCSQILTLPKARIKSFYEAMMFERNAVTNETILDVLTSWGMDVTKTGVDNHRRGYASRGDGVKQETYATHMIVLKKAAGLNG